MFIRCTDTDTGHVVEVWRRNPATEVIEYALHGVPVNESLAKLLAMMEESTKPPRS
jgi:muconolactone delta-isomerase